MWILILTLMVPNAANHFPSSMASVGGFKNQNACELAAIQWKQQMIEQGYPGRDIALCVPDVVEAK